MKRPSGPRPADTECTPTHTHRFSRAQEPPGRTFPLFLVSLWPPEPQVPVDGSPGRRGFETHRPKTDHTYKSSSFTVLLRVLRTHDTPHTYVHSLSSLAITIASYTDHLLSCCVISITLSRNHGVLNFGTRHPISLSLLSFDTFNKTETGCTDSA